jgi:hypothetical protein
VLLVYLRTVLVVAPLVSFRIVFVLSILVYPQQHRSKAPVYFVSRESYVRAIERDEDEDAADAAEVVEDEGDVENRVRHQIILTPLPNWKKFLLAGVALAVTAAISITLGVVLSKEGQPNCRGNCLALCFFGSE